jgi:hypothetical protein
VAVSYFHFAKSLLYVKYNGPFERFAKLLMKDEAPYAPYFPHLEGYLNLSQERPAQCLGVAFEDMKADPKAQIRRVAEFIGIEVEDEDVEAIAERTTFKAMKDNPRTNCSHWKDWGIFDKRKRTEFMRKGMGGLTWICLCIHLLLNSTFRRSWRSLELLQRQVRGKSFRGLDCRGNQNVQGAQFCIFP